jgi:hypothetical protein
MNVDDSRGNQNYPYRKPSPHKNSYSPNSVYYGNSNHNQQQQQQQQQKKKHQFGHNKGSSNINVDRLVKQNDTIIKLLKEIRDRLPAAANPAATENSDDFDQKSNFHHEKVQSQNENEITDMDADDGDEAFNNGDDDENENEQN